MIVIRQFIHRHMKGRHMKRTHMCLHCTDKRLTVSIQILSVLITVLLHTGQEPGHRLHKSIIVHDRIPFIALKPAFRVAVVLCKDQRIRICLLDCLAEVLPELMIELIAVSKVRCNIQSPSIYAIRLRHPFARDIQDIVIKFSGSFIIELRKRIVRPPAIIRQVVRPSSLVTEIEEITIRAVC